MDPPSGRVPEQGPSWFLVAIEACGGGTPDLGYFLEVSVFIGIFASVSLQGGLRVIHEGGGRTQGMGAPPTSWPPRRSPDVHSKSSGLLMIQKLVP